MSADPRRQVRQDTYDLRGEIHAEDSQNIHAHADALNYGTDEEEHSMLEDDSEQEETEEYMDDVSSTLSIPNESIDFDMVYALHSFAATVDGQANVVKGDSLYLMDDSNSYWWLVRVLKTQEVGYIPAENIETPFERLARLNKHRNVDLALPTDAENAESLAAAQDRVRNVALEVRSPSPDANRDNSRSNRRRTIHFNSVRQNHRYIPTLRDGEEEEEDEEWEVGGFEDEDLELAAEQMYSQSMDEDDLAASMDQDESMQWEDAASDIHARQQPGASIPDILQPGSIREHQEQLRLRQYQQEQLLQREAQERYQQQQQQQQQVELQKQQQQQQQEAQTTQQALRSVGSRERLAQDGGMRDPAEATETRKMTVTPTIAREYDDRPQNGGYLPSIVVDEDRKRVRDDTSSDDSSTKKAKGKDKMPAPVSSANYNNKSSPGKLRKDPGSKSDTEDEGKKKKSMFGNLFGGRNKKDKEKGKDRNASIGSLESGDYISRGSEDSSRSGHRPPTDGSMSPTTNAAQQQQQQAIIMRNAVADIQISAQDEQHGLMAPSTPERVVTPQVSEHANTLRERDQQQRDLYKQYLNRSPSSPPEAQPSYGLQSASSVMLSSPSTSSALGPPTTRPRPGSLILTSPSNNDGQANLSVIRVFAGKNLQTEATFKTVLLNPSTTANDLIRQAIQRFRLPGGDDQGEYFLTVKQVEGGASAILQPGERPLVVFETLVNEAMELPKVKRSSVGSISSISSNLSMHPAITKLSMNDFTDDSAVKFYLNHRSDNSLDDSLNGHEGDDTLTADMSLADTEHSMSKNPFLSISIAGANVASERFSSPSIRFALQLVIYAEDLPDDMQFHPQTEAIVFKSSLADPNAPVIVSPVVRRKIFMFPKNVTVAEVTELGLERFGIQDGVIDGGDEVEDKTTKRRSGVRVRYGLMVSIDGQERELAPSSKVIDAFPRLPQFRAPDRQPGGNKRRSLDSGQLLGSVDDIRSDDPVFILRRATSYRNSTSRRRSSAPLDEIALQHLHRESTSSYNSEVPVAPEDKAKQPSRQEIIAAQRAATRATQRAIVSASSNSLRGMDVVLPGNAVLRSSRYEVGDRMRYSYVEPDGESYDISDIMEQEWREMDSTRTDLLEGVFIRNKDGIGEKLDRVLNKIRKGKGKERDYSSLSSADSNRLSTRSASVSEYSADETEEGRPYQGVEHNEVLASPPRSDPVVTASPGPPMSRVGATTPTAPRPLPHSPAQIMASRRNPSISHVMSENSDGRGTPTQSDVGRGEDRSVSASTKNQKPRLVLPKDDFGVAHMMAIIEYKALKPQKAEKPLDPVDALLFGKQIDLASLHPAAREIYGPAFKHLDDIDKMLDECIGRSAVGAF